MVAVTAVGKECNSVAPVQRQRGAAAWPGPTRLDSTRCGAVRCGAVWCDRDAPEVGREDLELCHVTPKVHRSRVGRSRRALNLRPTSSEPAS